MFVVYHFNAATPIKQRYKRFGYAFKKAAKLGPGWFCSTEAEFLKLPFTTIVKA